MKKQAVIKVSKLTVKFQKKLVIEDLDWKIYDNCLISLLGSSGIGKSTLINAIIGLVKIQKGQISFLPTNLRESIGYVFQDSLLYEEISVYKNIYLSIKNSYHWIYQKRISKISNWINHHQLKVASFLATFRALQTSYDLNSPKWKLNYLFIKMVWQLMTHHKVQLAGSLVHQWSLKKEIATTIQALAANLKITDILTNNAKKISGGQRQRVAIAKALIKNSKIIFMDEPFSSLDADTKNQARDWLKDIQKKYKITIVIVTHDQNDAIMISDYIAYMSNKKILQYDESANFFEQPKNLEVAHFIGYPKINFIKQVNNHQFYLRPKYLKVSKTDQSNYFINKIINTGNQRICELIDKTNNHKLNCFLDNQDWQLHEFVKISYDDKHLIEFDQDGNNVFYE